MTLPLCILGLVCQLHTDLHFGTRDQHELTEREVMLDPMAGIRPIPPELGFRFSMSKEF